MTVREGIVVAMVAALNGGGKPAGVPTYVRNRIDHPTADQLPTNTVYQVAEKVEPMGGDRMKPGESRRGPVLRRFVDVAVETLVKAETGADAAADPMLAWSEQSLAAAGRVGSATHPADLMESKFSYEQGEETFCRATQMYRVWFQTKTGDPESVN